MNWKQLFANLAVASVVGGLTPLAQNIAAGTHTPITLGTTLVPIGLVAFKSLFALFQGSPLQSK